MPEELTTNYDVTIKTLRVHGRKNYGHDSEQYPLIVECLEPGCHLRLSAIDPLDAFRAGRIHQMTANFKGQPQCPFDPLHFKGK